MAVEASVAASETTGEQQPRRLVRYSVKGLFGGRDFAFEPARHGPTLLTGANGSGKSTILRSIYRIANGSWLLLQYLPFEFIQLDFENGPPLRVVKSENKFRVEHGPENSWDFDPAQVAPIDLDDLEFGLQREIRRTSPATWEFEGRTYTRKELEMALGIREVVEQDSASWVAQIPQWFRVSFITDQRLVVQPDRDTRHRDLTSLRKRRLEVRSVVSDYALDLTNHIARALSTYAAASQSLDRVFPRQVVEAVSASADVTDNELDILLDSVAERRKALESVGLLESEMQPAPFDERKLGAPTVRPVIRVFAENTLRKFETLDDIRRRLEVFTHFLNQHYERKRVNIDQRQGIVLTLEDSSQLQPTQLSSGEQQILVLAYQVLFQTDPGTLILIDEPELSLHVLWQSTLVDDLTTMGEARDLDFILATHSPTLIGDREDLKRSLDL